MRKIGQEISITEDYEVQCILSGKVLNVKKGDKALVTVYGLKHITGEARGKYAMMCEKPQGYDIDNIVKRIAMNLTRDLGGQDFLNYLEDIELTIEDVEDSIYDELEMFLSELWEDFRDGL